MKYQSIDLQTQKGDKVSKKKNQMKDSHVTDDSQMKSAAVSSGKERSILI